MPPVPTAQQLLMVPTSQQLFAQERADAQAERVSLHQRADVHEAAVAQEATFATEMQQCRDIMAFFKIEEAKPKVEEEPPKEAKEKEQVLTLEQVKAQLTFEDWEAVGRANPAWGDRVLIDSKEELERREQARKKEEQAKKKEAAKRKADIQIEQEGETSD